MKRAIVAVLFGLVAQPSLGETCQERFTRLFIDRAPKGPITIHVTQKLGAAAATVNENHQIDSGHWMSRMIEPANHPWTLAYGKGLYASTDQGKSWKKVRDLDSQQAFDDAIARLKEQAKTVRNATCDTDAIDGVAHDTVEAEYDNAAQKSTHKDRFWVNKATGWVSKATSWSKYPAFEMTLSQLISPAPDLKLPKPE